MRPPSGDCGRSATADFNPRTPVGCDSYRHHHNKRFHPFQSTHPSGVRPYALRLRFVSRDFNPRTPVGCDPMSGCRFGRLRISIHAPQWGATATPSPSLSSFVISIHAPQWGATVPYGCVFGVVVISIHAPQWGATRAALEPWARVANFNPRTPVGCDAQTGKDAGDHFKFQSTHPSGVRRGLRHYHGNRFISIHAPQWGATWPERTWASTPTNFNPRTPVGCDRVRFLRLLLLVISIHAPQWGATWRWRRNVATPKPFQSTHPSGVRPPDWDKPAYTALFQSTHPSGVRPTPAGCTVKHYQISIHAPQWGATGLLFAITCDTPYFNPRTPVGCDLVFGVPATASSLFQSTHPSGVRRSVFVQ